ncbi:hypothetical protein [Rosettibacter firmus]|uniref:hypothetical protein n=1 Tax=Rosettibacter firmus TaxID=3111522 RepID=UPI00336BB85D
MLNSKFLLEKNKLLNEHNRVVKVFEGECKIFEVRKNSLVSKLIELIRTYHYQFAGLVTFMVIIIVLFIIIKKPDIKYIDPTLVVIKNNVLYAYNGMEDLIWKKVVPGICDYATYKPYDIQKQFTLIRELLLNDLDNKGINELLLTGNYTRIRFYFRYTLLL